MSSTQRNRDDIAAGLLIAAVGAGAAITALSQNRLGTTANMGSAYMPAVLGALLAVLGLLVAFRALRQGSESPLAVRASLRPLGFVLGAVLLFAFLVSSIGVVLTSAVTIIAAAFGSREARLKETAILAAAVSLGAAFVFVKLLGLPFKLWPF